MAEETLYTGGFNYKYEGQEKISRKLVGRYSLCKQFSDKRLSYFGLRLIFEESPETLPSNVREKIERSVTRQLTSLNKEKWKTCVDFDKEIEIIENTPNTISNNFLFELKEIKKYFDNAYGKISTKT